MVPPAGIIPWCGDAPSDARRGVTVVSVRLQTVVSGAERGGNGAHAH